MWIITHDFLEGEVDQSNAVGVASRDFDESQRHRLQHPFRMLDDDGELYYQGLSDDACTENALAPLDDFGMGYAGCTEIHYLVNGVWNPI